MREAYDAIKRIEYYRGVDHFVIVQFTKIFDLCKATLVELEVILLKTQGDLFEQIVDAQDHETRMVAVERPYQHC